MSGEDSFLCSICFKPVNVKTCKIDELGRPLHETCYSDGSARVEDWPSIKKALTNAGYVPRVKLPPAS